MVEKIDWKEVAPGSGRHIDLPKYPWQRQQYWAESPDSRHRRLAAPTHPLLGVREPGPARQWEACVSADQFPYLADHGFRGRAVFPAAGHIELMLAAAADGSFADPVGLADVNFDRVLWADQPHVIQTAFDPATRRLSVSARPVGDAGKGWELCSRGVRWAADTSGANSMVRGTVTPPPDATPVPAEDLYARKARRGYCFSKDWSVHQAITFFTMYSYNFCWPVRTLRVKAEDGTWRSRTPAMAAGLADHVWSLSEWLTLPDVHQK